MVWRVTLTEALERSRQRLWCCCFETSSWFLDLVSSQYLTSSRVTRVTREKKRKVYASQEAACIKE
eukprot:1140741-Pelagomonas_calceolata.AAC.4